MRFKVHNVDAIARAKGFRRNHTYEVRGFDLDAKPERGPLLLLRNRDGKTEGFYPDQGRWVDRGPPMHRWLARGGAGSQMKVRGFRSSKSLRSAPPARLFVTSTGRMTLPGVPENLPRGDATG